MKFRNAKGQYCSKEEWNKIPIKKRFIQFLKYHNAYEKYREEIKKSDWWENGKPKFIKDRKGYISDAFLYIDGSNKRYKFWRDLTLEWEDLITN